MIFVTSIISTLIIDEHVKKKDETSHGKFHLLFLLIKIFLEIVEKL